ncbi:MAG: response regulator transcription factor [Chloroflexi bacterium]|nr:response regulator transcription factor [Chloroflexota bacterium]
MKVLVIDDDKTLSGLIKQSMTKAGYKVTVANNGIEGLQQVLTDTPDIVILDVMMPRMDGWETCHRIRQSSKVPIIMLTAKDQVNDKVRGFELGVDDYMTKPFSLAELGARVKAVTSRAGIPSDTRPHRITSGELVIDVDGHRVTKRGEPVSLTPTEYKLLLTLAENGGRVLSHEQLLERVWGYETEEDNDYVKRYIWYLRRKIEDDPSQPLHVVTERGFGYSFQTDAPT